MEVQIENQYIQDELVRSLSTLGEEDPYTAGGNIGIKDVLRAHFLIADYFYTEGYGLGGLGPRDPALLHSAVYRQFAGYSGRDKWQTSYEKSATLIFGLVKDHPFHDANKRTALLILLYSLVRIKRVPTSTQKELEDFVVDIAEDKLKARRLRALRKARTDDPEVRYIADYLKRNSRGIERAMRSITYRELDLKLREFGYCLNNPHNNYIDVCRMERSRKYLVFGRRGEKLVKIYTVGFPGWKRQVGKSIVSKIREVAELTPDKGIDSSVFYDGRDPLYSLISEYAGPLERLAYR